MKPESLLEQRHEKFRKIGEVEESGPVDSHIKRNMKKRDAAVEDEEVAMLPSGNNGIGAPEPLIIATGEASRE